MLTRRRLLHGTTVALPGLSGLSGLSACSPETRPETYDEAIRRTWHLARSGREPTDDNAMIRRELVRLSTLAPSSHNSQCWKFHIERDAITILPDLTRRCPAVDPDDHHLFVSLGCATENLIQAALANGLKGQPSAQPASDGSIRVELASTRAFASPLYEAIATRQCSRSEFDGRPVSAEEMKLLEQAGTGAGVTVMLLTGKQAMEQVLQYVVEGNTAQLSDTAFVAELKAWIRFGSGEAVHRSDGLYSVSSGNPSLPRWLGSRLFSQFFTASGENERYAKQIRSSRGIAVFVSDVNDKAHWIEAGRCYERFALQATALGIRNAMINQPVEVSALRPRFAAALGLQGGRPDLVVRFGRGPGMPSSLRRPVDEVLV